jgi:hypothetical protein
VEAEEEEWDDEATTAEGDVDGDGRRDQVATAVVVVCGALRQDILAPTTNAAGSAVTGGGGVSMTTLLRFGRERVAIAGCKLLCEESTCCCC